MERLNWHKVCAQYGAPQSSTRKHVEWPTVFIICSAMSGKGMSFWHEWWLEMSLGVITSNQNRNDKVSSGSFQGHHHQKNLRPSTQVQERLCWHSSLIKMVTFWQTLCSMGQQWIPSITRKPWPLFAKWSNRNDEASSPVGSFCSTTMQGLIRPTQSRHSCGNSSGRFLVTLHTVQTSLWLCHFWSPRKSSEGQMIHLGWRQALHAELVHNATLGILRDSYSPPCVAVGQQPGPILLTYRYWSLFLGLRSFLLECPSYYYKSIR